MSKNTHFMFSSNSIHTIPCDIKSLFHVFIQVFDMPVDRDMFKYVACFKATIHQLFLLKQYRSFTEYTAW